MSGFAPHDASEQCRLDDARRALSFDPTTQSHRLTAHPNDALTDAKRVLTQLTDGDRDREHACLGDRERLHQRGERNGARAFLDEIDARIVPVFARRA